jgi:2-polyprenyl-3-methyl-5-hydroxy-6-metoxy-1,4-benzoquinol methylase
VADEPIRRQYERYGAQGFYERFGARYRNPHEWAVRQTLQAAVTTWSLDLSRVLDLACGSGEVTLALRELGALAVAGVDPYTGAAYLARTGQNAETLSFESIAAGALEGRRYSLVVCSYALHLLEPSRLPRLAYQLSRTAAALLVLTPHKRPHLRPEWGWQLVGEMVVERVRARHYRST